ncbi:MAG: FKBP-type peptidyl-prolyl cis-trans isomerase [Clostridia bacterium]|nr:FKBP-type peptidyl-prolyl cis-trans isomerase [Clostridia bacterium]
MKKTLALVLTAAMLALSLVSCGSFDVTKVDLVADGYVTVGDYENLDLNLADYEAEDPTDADVYAHAVEHLGHSEDVATVDRAAEEFDLVNIAFVGSIDGVEFEGGTSDSTDLVIGAGNFIDGFEDGIIGMNIGETKDVTATFPEDYGKEELNGKEAVFAITLNTVYDPAVLDDVRAELTTEYDEETLKTDVWAALEESVTVVNYPANYVKELADAQYKYYEYMYRSWGMMDDMEDLGVTMESCEEYAKSQIDYEFAVYALANAQGITATEEELAAKVAEYVATYVGYGYTEEEANSMFSTESVESEVLYEKLVDAAIATLEAAEPVAE